MNPCVTHIDLIKHIFKETFFPLGVYKQKNLYWGHKSSEYLGFLLEFLLPEGSSPAVH